MNFTEAVSSFFKNYAVLEGRSSRSEYLYAYLFLVMVSVPAVFLEETGALPTFFTTVFQWVVLVPSIAITTRRLHDIGKSGWWHLLAFTIVGIIPLFYWVTLQAGDEGDNQYGSNPLKSSA
jgi:uncharacterized membrane protein YhaH (DUF805 family)